MVTGRLAGDPEQRHTSGGKSVANFSVPISKGRDGETTWVRVAAWGQRGDFVMSNFSKGSGISCAGPMRVREWEGNGKAGFSLEMDADQVTFASDAPGVGQSQSNRSNDDFGHHNAGGGQHGYAHGDAPGQGNLSQGGGGHTRSPVGGGPADEDIPFSDLAGLTGV
jgi:single stranded DNA-binding protein